MSLTPMVSGILGRMGLGGSAESRASAEFAGEVAAELGLDQREREQIELAAILRDVGREAALEDIADSPDGPATEDLERYRSYPARSAEMLQRLGEPFAAVAATVRACHERFDGAGYPDGLAGEEIPLGARIITVCDAYDAMTVGRAYGVVQDHAGAVASVWAESGSRFDPGVVPALVRVAGRSRAEGQEPAAAPQVQETPNVVPLRKRALP